MRRRHGAIGIPLLSDGFDDRAGTIIMLIIILLAILVVGVAFVTFLVRAAVRADQLSLRLEPSLLSAVTNFFDTLGIGSFAPTMAWMRFRRIGLTAHAFHRHPVGE